MSFRSAGNVFNTSISYVLTWASTSDTSSLCVSGVGRTSTWNSILMNTWRHTQVRSKYPLLHYEIFNAVFFIRYIDFLMFFFNRRETIHMWDLWKELYKSTQYEAASSHAHWREALPLWSVRSAVPLLKHAESSQREVFKGQESSDFWGLSESNSSTITNQMETARNRDLSQDGNTERCWIRIISGWCAVTYPSHSQLTQLTLICCKDRHQEPVTNALWYIVSFIEIAKAFFNFFMYFFMSVSI